MEGLSGLYDWKLQFGAFAIAAMLILLLVWYIKFNTNFLLSLFKSHGKLQEATNVVLSKTQKALIENGSATNVLIHQLERMEKTQNRLLREMLSRPCLLDAQVQEKIRKQLEDFEQKEIDRQIAEKKEQEEANKCPNTKT